MVACALHDEPMPTVDEQRALLDHFSATAEVAARLMAPAPDLGMSVLDALEVLCSLRTPEMDP